MTDKLLFVSWLIMVAALFAFKFAEGTCQAQHHVADCEWTRNPFTPVESEGEK